MKEFWRSWGKITKREEKAIKSLNKARKIILKNIPKKELVAIYAKGSMIRREMKEKSDVDTVTVLKTGKYIKKLERLNKDYKDKFDPKIQIKPCYTLVELKTGKKKRKTNSPSPSRFVKHLKHYELIYGKSLAEEIFPTKDNKEELKNMVKVFRELFLPNYEKGKLGFSDLVKQTFWLTENEERARGREPVHNWGKLAKSIKDGRHIVHDALRYRKKNTKDKKERVAYIRKLKVYLKKLEKLVK